MGRLSDEMEGFKLTTFRKIVNRGRVEEEDEEANIEGIQDRRLSISSLPLPSSTRVDTTETRTRSSSTPESYPSPLVRSSREVIVSFANSPTISPTPATPTTPNAAILPPPVTNPQIPAVAGPANSLPTLLTNFWPPQRAALWFHHHNLGPHGISVWLFPRSPPTFGVGRLYRQHHRRYYQGPLRRWAWRNRDCLHCCRLFLMVVLSCAVGMAIIVGAMARARMLY